MKSTQVSELKVTLSQCLAKVKAGEELIVMERGKPIAKLIPMPRQRDTETAQLADLVRARPSPQWVGEIAGRVLETSAPERPERAGVASLTYRTCRGPMKFWDASALIPLPPEQHGRRTVTDCPHGISSGMDRN